MKKLILAALLVSTLSSFATVHKCNIVVKTVSEGETPETLLIERISNGSIIDECVEALGDGTVASDLAIVFIKDDDGFGGEVVVVYKDTLDPVVIDGEDKVIAIVGGDDLILVSRVKDSPNGDRVTIRGRIFASLEVGDDGVDEGSGTVVGSVVERRIVRVDVPGTRTVAAGNLDIQAQYEGVSTASGRITYSGKDISLF